MASKRKFEESNCTGFKMEPIQEYHTNESVKRKFEGDMCDYTSVKRKFEGGGGDDTNIKRFNDSNRDKFEYTHLHRTNQEMADFVRDAIVFMRAQQEEIDQLKSIIRQRSG